MDKTIETKFFEAFKCGGVVYKCIDWMRYTYNLPPIKPRASTSEREGTPEQRKAKEKWDNYYRTLPKEILEATEAFDEAFDDSVMSQLMDEIEANLNDCQTDVQIERYLFSLLKPFGESPSGCGIARVYEPTAELKQLEDEIKHCEGKKDSEAIERYKVQIDWVLYVNDQFIDLTCTDKDKEGSVERCLGVFVGIMTKFANRLDALLLTYGIDLMRLQKDSGLYLKGHRVIADVESYIGSMELAQRYIDVLPKEPHPEQANNEPTADTRSLIQDKQQEKPKPTRGRGRPKATLKDKMIDDPDGEKLQEIHAKMNGKKGKDAALIILACINKGWMMKPTFTQVSNEFGDIGCKTGYNKYLNACNFTKEEIEGVKQSLIEH